MNQLRSVETENKEALETEGLKTVIKEQNQTGDSEATQILTTVRSPAQPWAGRAEGGCVPVEARTGASERSCKHGGIGL